jgi:hypothetical protein
MLQNIALLDILTPAAAPKEKDVAHGDRDAFSQILDSENNRPPEQKKPESEQPQTNTASASNSTPAPENAPAEKERAVDTPSEESSLADIAPLEEPLKTEATTPILLPPLQPTPTPLATVLQNIVDFLAQKPVTENADTTLAPTPSLIGKINDFLRTASTSPTTAEQPTPLLQQFVASLAPQELKTLAQTLNTLNATPVVNAPESLDVSASTPAQQPIQNDATALMPVILPVIDTTQRADTLTALQNLVESVKNPQKSNTAKTSTVATEADNTATPVVSPLLQAASITPPVALASDAPVVENNTALSITAPQGSSTKESQPEITTQPEQRITPDTKESLQEVSTPTDKQLNAVKDSFNASLLAAQNDNKAAVAAPISSAENTQQQAQQLHAITESKNVIPQGLAAKLPTTLAVVEQISLQMRKATDEGISRIRIKMQPASLGAIDIKMEVSHDGAVKAVLGIEKHETFEWLQKDFRHLERILQDTGLKTDSNSLSFHYRGGGQDQQSGQQQQPFGNSNYNPEKETFLEAKISLLGDAPPLSAPKQGLDIKV